MFNFLKNKEENSNKQLHVALDINNVEKWAEKQKIELPIAYQKCFLKIKELMELQVNNKTPIFSFLILPLNQTERTELLKSFCQFIDSKIFWQHLITNKVKVTLLGKWYNLPTENLNSLKRVVECSKDYDQFFLNFYLNYDGQEEIVDAVKLIYRQVLADKLSLENINPEMIKDNLYTSYFIPPTLIIKNEDNILNSFLLWDSVGAKMKITEKEFMELSVSEIDKMLKE